jgi:hypothetical protein
VVIGVFHWGRQLMRRERVGLSRLRLTQVKHTKENIWIRTDGYRI